MRERDKEVLKELVSEIKKKFPDADVILFGSKARRDDIEESDIDLLILLEKKDRKTVDKIIDICFCFELRYDVVISPLIHTKEEWNSFPYNVSEIKYFVEKEGIRL